MKIALTKQKRLYFTVRISLAAGIFTGFLLSPCAASTLMPPDQPYGLIGLVDSVTQTFTLMWDPVRQTEEGIPLPTLAGYNVYRRPFPLSEPEKMNTYLVPVVTFADRLENTPFYYSVRAVDSMGNESAESMLVESSDKANIVFLGDDQFTYMTIPGNLADVMRANGNRYEVPLSVDLQEEEDVVSVNNAIVRGVRFQFIRTDTKQPVTDVRFASAGAKINVGYNMIGGQVAIGAPGFSPVSGAPVLTDATPDQLSLFWFNGVVWIKLGGAHEKNFQSLSIEAAHLGRYQLRLSAPANSLTLSKANVFPGLFTPNSDGFNDRVYMILENPVQASIMGEIWDIFGHHVATLPPPTQSSGTNATLEWNGQDANGAIVPSGLYLYRIRGGEKTLTGTVSVAR